MKRQKDLNTIHFRQEITTKVYNENLRFYPPTIGISSLNIYHREVMGYEWE